MFEGNGKSVGGARKMIEKKNGRGMNYSCRRRRIVTFELPRALPRKGKLARSQNSWRSWDVRLAGPY